MALGLFWDIVTGLPWTPNGVGSLEPKEYYIFLPGAHYLTINSPDGADSSLNKLLLLLLPAQHSLLWCIEYWLHWLLQPFCCYQLRRLALCAFIINLFSSYFKLYCYFFSFIIFALMPEFIISLPQNFMLLKAYGKIFPNSNTTMLSTKLLILGVESFVWSK